MEFGGFSGNLGGFIPLRPDIDSLKAAHQSGLRDGGFICLTPNHESELIYMIEIYVRQNNVDQALRALKKKLQNEGVLREMKARKHYEKPSEKRVREKAEAVRRARKLARKRAQLEGLIPSKKKPRRR